MSGTGRNAIVVGAASGIGAAVARRFAATDHLELVDVQATPLQDLATELGAASAVVDLADDAAIDAYLAARAAGGPVDVVVISAGIVGTGTSRELTRESYRRVQAINLESMVQICLSLRDRLAESAQGRIVLIGSVQGEFAAADSLAYAVSKGGVHSLTRSLAVDLALDGTLVNAVAPGFIDTPMAALDDGTTEYDTEWFKDVFLRHGRLPLRRPGAAAEVAEVVAFLASPANTYMTGQVVTVDGGMTATF